MIRVFYHGKIRDEVHNIIYGFRVHIDMRNSYFC
jgi:hypothetical protein